MNPRDIEKLLGGYATDTLSEEERRTLFEAALGNQALFDALADEQALRELLQDSPSRAQLLAALGEERESPWARFAAWMRRPSVMALAAAMAAGIVTIAVVIPRMTPTRPTTVAMSTPKQPEPAPLRAVPEGAPQPKHAPAKPSVNLRRAETAPKDQPERDAAALQHAPAAPAPAATLPPPPVVSPVVAIPAQPQFAANEEAQKVQSKLADAMRPTGASGYRPEARKEAIALGARDLYYEMQPSAVSGFVDQPRAKARQRSFGGAGVVAGTPKPAPVRAGGVRYSILKRNTDGSFAEVDPAMTFAAGDALRVRFETNQPGSLGVMELQANGKWTLRMAARMQQGEPVHMPSEGTIDIRTPGATRFFVRFSRGLRSEPQLDQITPTANLRQESAANSVYVVNPAWFPEAVVDFELTINAK